jgi:hypothetical protein
MVSTLVGFVAGSGAAFWDYKNNPATQTAENSTPQQVHTPVSDKQEVVPPKQEVVPPKQEVVPPKQEAGPAKDVDSNLPKVVAPQQPDRPVPQKIPDNERLAAATAFPGLKFYLNCDAITDGGLTDSVSGKLVKGVNLELVDGMRGKAARISHDPTDGMAHGLDLSPVADSLGIDASKPFTLAFWLRRTFTEKTNGSGAQLLEAFRTRGGHRHLMIQMLPNSRPTLLMGNLLEADASDQSLNKAYQPRHQLDLADQWSHITIIRDENGLFRLMVNGADFADEPPKKFNPEMRYDTFYILKSFQGRTVIDLDEFCFFDRALRDEELSALTGLKIAPKPKEVILPEPKVIPPGSVPAATEIKGLRFYLEFDKIENGAVFETVSGKFVGKGPKLSLVDGPRGKALHATAGAKGGVKTGLDLSAHADAFSFAEDKPFTFTLWVRSDEWDTVGARFLEGQFIGTEIGRFFYIQPLRTGVGYLLSQSIPGGGNNPANFSVHDQRAIGISRDWVHLMLSRDEKGVVRFGVNGEVKTSPRPFKGRLSYSSFALGMQYQGAFTADYDEFCVFDRALTDEEIRKLAGKSK